MYAYKNNLAQVLNVDQKYNIQVAKQPNFSSLFEMAEYDCGTIIYRTVGVV